MRIVPTTKARFHLVLTVFVLLHALTSPRPAPAQEPKGGDLSDRALELAQAGKLAEAGQSLNTLPDQTNRQVSRLLISRANLRAQAGRFREATGDLERAIQMNPADHEPWTTLTPLLVQTGETAKYRAHCHAMLRRFKDTTEAPIANRVAKSCLLAPSALDPEDLIQGEKMADKSVELTEDGQFYPWRSMTRALAEFRRGGFARASEMIEDFQKEMGGDDLSGDWYECKADAWFISAMARQRLKETDRARAAFERGRLIVREKLPSLTGGDLGGSWWDVLMAYMLMSEAGRTLGGNLPGQP